MKPVLTAGALFLALAACAPRASLRPVEPNAVRLKNVPFFPNTTDQCGPAALAGVLNYWGKPATPEEIKSQIYLPKIRGTLPMDMRPALENNGLSGQVISGSFDDIKAELRNNRPVIAYLDFGTRKHPIGHFLIVTGFDDERKGLYVHSGASKNKFASYRRFDRGWKDADRWLLLVGPNESAEPANLSRRRPPRLEERMSADDHYRLGAIYEARTSTAEAVVQYERALAQNKKFEPALMALGNVAFNAGDYKRAASYYRRVLRINKSHGGANNNLAMVYLSSGGDLKAAETYARRAMGTDYEIFAKDTLEKIREKQL